MQPHNDYLLVRADPLKDQSGSLFLVREGNIRTATVVKLGPGKLCPDGSKRVPIDTEEGARVAFLRWNAEHRPGKTLASAVHAVEGDDVFLIQEKDILLTWTGPDPDLW